MSTERRNVEMKKLIFGASILALLSVGVLLFRLKIDYKKDVIISSKDEKVTLVFEQVTAETVEEQPAYFTTIFSPVSIDAFYEEYIEDKDYYVCSFTKSMKKTDGETGIYLLEKDNHFFLLELDREEVAVKEMISAYYPPDYYCSPIFSVTFLDPALPHSEKKQVLWDEMILVGNWAELINFYDSINWHYQLEGDILFLSAYDVYSSSDHEIWYDNAIKITEFPNGIEIELIKDGLPTSDK